jgi:hypothetical protein
VRQPRVWEKTGYLPRKTSEDYFISTASPFKAHLAFEDDCEIVKRFTLPAHDLSGLKVEDLKMFRQPVELIAGQVRKDLYLAQIAG